MNVSISQVIVWLIVGAIAGWLAGMVVKRRREGFGPFTNLGIGLVGVLIGASIFRIFKIDLGLGELAISFQDLVEAFAGSLVFLAVAWIVQRSRGSRSE